MLVRVRNPEFGRKNVWFFDQPEYFEYSGEEVRVKHVSADELALTTGNPEWPVRVIRRDRILSIDGRSVAHIEVKAETRIVKGSKGQEYVVTNSQGRWTCTCPGFQFRRSCKHTAGV